MNLDPFIELRSQWRESGLVPGYTFLNILGAGGQGLVFKARKNAIGRTYAIKFLRPPDATNPAAWRTSELEHTAELAELRHPGLVSLEDRGEALGLVWLCFEYAGERSLKAALQDPNLVLSDGLHYLDQAAEALGYLHKCGVLHMDVKPSNIFLLEGRAKLGDFGLIRPSSLSGPIDLSVALGTPVYAAPEVIRTLKASPASDVFGLGRTLDDLVIACSARSHMDPSQEILSLIADSTHDLPARRPSIDNFRERLSAQKARAGRRIVFRPVATPEPRTPLFLGSGQSPRARKK